MIARVFDDNNDWATYYCTLCTRPFKALHEANKHGRYCGQDMPIQPTFKSYTTAATFEDTEFDGRIGDDATQFYQNEARTWQGLTDDEYQEILKQHDGAGLLAFFNLVEAKLKEKNT